MIERDTINEIIYRSDIVSIVSEYVNLRKRGQNFIGLCPFHNEKTPSFSVSPNKQIFHCFGCGAGGNVITFVMKSENYSFVDTVKLLGDKCGIEIKLDKNQASRSPLMNIMQKTSQFYQNQLYGDEGKSALSYIRGRGLSDDLIKELKIGYAPKGYKHTYNYLKKSGFEDEQLDRSGIVYKRDNGEMLDRFRNRLMFPISNSSGETIAFGGRIMPQEQDQKSAKYINSPESEIYYKGSMLYGLSLTKDHIRREKKVIVVEGYMDFIACYVNGIKNVVATLGTSMTKKQANILKYYADEVVMGYDSDLPGQNAALKASMILQEIGVQVRIATFSDKDPDETIKNKGLDSLLEQLDDAKSFIMFKIEKIVEEYNIETAEGINNIVTQSINFFNQISDEALVGEYVRKLAEMLNKPEEEIRSKLKQLKDYKRKGFRGKFKVDNKENADKFIKAQESIIRIISKDTELRLSIKNQMTTDDFSDQKLKSLYTIINNTDATSSEIVEMVDDEDLRNLYVKIVMDEITEEVNSLHSYVNVVKERKKTEYKKQLEKSIKDAEDKNDYTTQEKLLKEYTELLSQK